MMKRAKPIGHQYVAGTHPAFEDDDDFELPSMFRSQRDSKPKVDIRAAARSQLTFGDRGEGVSYEPVPWLETLQTAIRSLDATQGGVPGQNEAVAHGFGTPQDARAQLPLVFAGQTQAIPRQMVSFKDTLMSRMGQPRRRPELGSADTMTPDPSSPGQSIDEEEQGAFALRD
jgi:hypothetical protein